MINGPELNTETYCKDCPHFDGKVELIEKNDNVWDLSVTCSNCEICSHVVQIILNDDSYRNKLYKLRLELISDYIWYIEHASFDELKELRTLLEEKS